MDGGPITGSLPDGSIRGTIPISVVLSWPPPNYDNPIRRPWMAALAVPLAVASTFTVSVRLWSRFTRQVGNFGIDDICIVLSWMFAIALSAIAVINAEKYGFDRHVWDTRLDQHVPSAMYGWIGDNVFLISTCLCKIAVLLLYRRMVAGTCSKKMLWASWIGIAFTAIYGIVFIALLCTTCKPLDAYWKSYDLTYTGPYNCVRPGAGMAISGSLSVASDFYAVVLPYFLVRNLQISTRQKFGLYIVFGFGLLVVGCGIARTIYLDRLASRSYDLTWVGFDVFAASLLESQLSIIGACLPNLRKMFGTYFGDSLSKAYSNIRYGVPKGIASSKDSKMSEGRRAIGLRDKKILSTTDDIELTAGSVTIDTGSVAKGNAHNSVDHDYFEKAFVKRFANATLTEDDLPTRESHNGSKPQNGVYPHTVY
ncbi:hypothetical protein EV356DRAFT_528056 [Viridothelium virens]|uniref:Rhodopsin domain-containing protein n=1 Tax=Viridothelium virens TaxID=1048519 RepID=A0A6A6HNT3_VIRVR|nr:hypothetical protein EV356DRAFT_528056 [Viridothelium virens]